MTVMAHSQDTSVSVACADDAMKDPSLVCHWQGREQGVHLEHGLKDLGVLLYHGPQGVEPGHVPQEVQGATCRLPTTAASTLHVLYFCNNVMLQKRNTGTENEGEGGMSATVKAADSLPYNA